MIDRVRVGGRDRVVLHAHKLVLLRHPKVTAVAVFGQLVHLDAIQRVLLMSVLQRALLELDAGVLRRAAVAPSLILDCGRF